MMETLLRLALVVMMAMALIRAMSVSMTGMDPTGLNVDQTLMERLVVIGLDLPLLFLQMEMLLPLERIEMMAMGLIRVMSVCSNGQSVQRFCRLGIEKKLAIVFVSLG
jgi:hypothetical protein